MPARHTPAHLPALTLHAVRVAVVPSGAWREPAVSDVQREASFLAEDIVFENGVE